MPYDHITKANQYLSVFESGDHLIFSDATGNRGYTLIINKQPSRGGDRS